MIKAVIFDFGNVICSFDNNIFVEKIAKFTDKSFQELNKLIYLDSKLHIQYESGSLTSGEFFKKTVKLCDLKISREVFVKAYTDIFTPIPTTFSLIRKLKLNYKLGLLSNTNELDFEYAIKPIKIFNLFDAVTLSFKIKAMKPDERVFYDLLEKLDLQPEECVYIDDIKKYTDAAEEIGIKGIHYLSYEQLCDSLRNLKILF